MPRLHSIVFAALGLLAVAATARAQDYKIDPNHTQVAFVITHLGISHVRGMFTDVSGSIHIDAADVSKSSFQATIKTQSIYTGVKMRDDDLRSPKFFSVKEFPEITFKSTKVAAMEGGYEVTGDLALHGVTKSVTLKIKNMGDAEFPNGTHRTGFVTQLDIKRSDYGMKTMLGPVADEVHLDISIEGIKQ